VKAGDEVTIYEDPLTCQKIEGVAKLLFQYHSKKDGNLERWRVRFPDLETDRWIKTTDEIMLGDYIADMDLEIKTTCFECENELEYFHTSINNSRGVFYSHCPYCNKDRNVSFMVKKNTVWVVSDSEGEE
jgi:hypothetical protein